MAFSVYTKVTIPLFIGFGKNKPNLKFPVRNLMSKQLVYKEFGDPLHVVKYREHAVAPLGNTEVLVRMLAAPVNPADINTIQGRNYALPKLPTVAGDEGVGEVVEVGKLIGRIKCGDRVILSSRLKGTWRVYGIYGERDLHVISPKLPLPEASMISIAPCTAYRLIKNFRKIHPGETIVQNGANSPVGQSVIQLCKAWDIYTINIVSSHCGFESVKDYLLQLGASLVYTLDEAEQITNYHSSIARPALALNCLGGRYEDLMLKMLDHEGVLVYYGGAYDMPLTKEFMRCDVTFCKFHLNEWDRTASGVEKDKMLNDIIRLSATGKFRAPVYEPVELKNYIQAFKNTVKNEAFANKNYVFDFTLP